MAESAPSPHPSPRELFEQLIQGVSEQRWDELADLYAEDAVVEHPFASRRRHAW